MDASYTGSLSTTRSLSPSPPHRMQSLSRNDDPENIQARLRLVMDGMPVEKKEIFLDDLDALLEGQLDLAGEVRRLRADLMALKKKKMDAVPARDLEHRDGARHQDALRQENEALKAQILGLKGELRLAEEEKNDLFDKVAEERARNALVNDEVQRLEDLLSRERAHSQDIQDIGEAKLLGVRAQIQEKETEAEVISRRLEDALVNARRTLEDQDRVSREEREMLQDSLVDARMRADIAESARRQLEDSLSDAHARLDQRERDLQALKGILQDCEVDLAGEKRRVEDERRQCEDAFWQIRSLKDTLEVVEREREVLRERLIEEDRERERLKRMLAEEIEQVASLRRQIEGLSHELQDVKGVAARLERQLQDKQEQVLDKESMCVRLRGDVSDLAAKREEDWKAMAALRERAEGAEGALHVAERARDTFQELAKDLAKESDNLKRQIEDLQFIIEQSTQELARSREKSEGLVRLLDEAMKEAARLGSELESTKEGVEDGVRSARQAAARSKELETVVKELEGRLLQSDEALADREDKVGRLREEARVLTMENARLEGEGDVLRREAKSLNEALDERTSTIKRYEDELRERNNSIFKLERDSDALKWQLDEQKRVLFDKEERIVRLDAELSGGLKKMGALRAEGDALQGQLADVRELLASVEEDREALKRDLKTSLKHKDGEMEVLREEAAVVQKEIEALRREIKIKESEIAGLQYEGSGLKGELEALREEEDAIKQTLKAALRSKEKEIDDLAVELAAAKEVDVSWREGRVQLQEMKASLKGKEDEIERLREEADESRREHEKRLKKKDGEVDRLRGDIKMLERDCDALKSEMDACKAEKALLRDEREVLADELERKDKELRAQKVGLSEELERRERELAAERRRADEASAQLVQALRELAEARGARREDGSAGELEEARADVLELSALLTAEQAKAEELLRALEHAQAQLDGAKASLKEARKSGASASKKDVALLRDLVDERDRTIDVQRREIRKLTVKMTSVLSARGKFQMIAELDDEPRDTRAGLNQVLESFVLDVHMLRPDFSDTLYSYVFALQIAWCQASWATDLLMYRFAGVLRVMSRQDALKESMIAGGCVDFLLHVVDMGAVHETVLLQAVSCLSNLALKVEASRVQLVDAGVVPYLIKLLGGSVSTNSSVRERACSALANLACGEHTKMGIVEQGAVPFLIHICSLEPADTCTEEAARCLRNLAHSSDMNRRVIANEGGIRVLAGICRTNKHKGAVMQAHAALSNLAANEANKIEMRETGQLPSDIDKLLYSSHSSLHMNGGSGGLGMGQYEEHETFCVTGSASTSPDWTLQTLPGPSKSSRSVTQAPAVRERPSTYSSLRQ